MTGQGVILYGPPASGKDTITRELTRIDPRFALFWRLKVGQAPMPGYRPITRPELDDLSSAGRIAWQNDRYATTYAVDTPALAEHLTKHITVLHLGQVPAVEAIRTATAHTAWLVIELWCDRATATTRLHDRGSTDIAERLTAWDHTDPLPTADHRIDTGQTSAQDTAQMIATWLELTSRT